MNAGDSEGDSPLAHARCLATLPAHSAWGYYFDCFAKSENGIGCFPLTHHFGDDFDHGRIMRPVCSLFRFIEGIEASVLGATPRLFRSQGAG